MRKIVLTFGLTAGLFGQTLAPSIYEQSTQKKEERKGVGMLQGGEPSAADVLNARCVKCHNSKDPASLLDLSSYEGLVRGGRRIDKLIVVGNPRESRLVQVILGMDKEVGHMPPAEQEWLSWKEVLAIGDWIYSGGGKVAFSMGRYRATMGGKKK